ncbi:MAG: hypothetical protein U0O43_06370 [Clostridia bacterium]
MGNVNKYNRCNFCENKPTFHGVRCSDGDGNEFYAWAGTIFI